MADIGTPVSQIFKQAVPASKAGTAPKPGAVPKPSNMLGTPVSSVFKTLPAPKGKVNGLLAEVRSKGEAGLASLKALGTQALQRVNPAANQEIKSYTTAAFDQLEHDFKQEPSQWKSGVPQGVKVALDTLNAIWAPLNASVDQAVSAPIKQGLDKLASLTTQWQEWTPEERRKAWEKGEPMKFQNELQEQLKNVKGLVDPAINALEMMPLPEAAGTALGIEKGSAALRTTSRALHDSLEPEASAGAQVSHALDKTMGFKQVAANLEQHFNNIARGSVVPAHQILDQMLPHAQGYAKSFISALKAHMNPKVTIKFSDHAGQDVASLGVYHPSAHTIEIKQGQPDIIHTVTHEMYHATTVNVIDTLMDQEFKDAMEKKGGKLTLNEAIQIAHNPKSPMLKELDGIIKEARLRWQRAGLGKEVWQKVGYGLQPEYNRLDLEWYKMPGWEKAFQAQIKRYEFVAELYSNPHLQEFLANSEKYASSGYKFKNMLNQFGLMIGKHLGLTKPHDLQLLNQAMSVGSRLMRLQSEVAADKKTDFRRIVVARTEDGKSITRGDMQAATTLTAEMGDVVDYGARLTERASKLRSQLSEIQQQMNEALKLGEAGHPRFIALSARKEAMQKELMKVNEASENFGRRSDGPLSVASLGANSSLYPQGINPDVERYDVIDGKTGQKVGSYDGSKPWAARRARAFADKKDAEYGGYRYRVEPVRRKPLEVSRKAAKRSTSEVKTALQLSVEGLLRTVAPEALGKNAKLAASVVASRIAEQMQKTAAWRFGSKTRLKFWRARPDLAKTFINEFEAGKSFSDPELSGLAKKYRDWNAKIADNEAKLGFNYEPRENYLFHLFNDSEGVANYFERKYGAKWGDPKFIKSRTFDMYKEAIAAGFTPVYDNPEDIMLARQQASDIAEMNIGILNDLASYGLATRKVKGETKLVKKVDADGKVTLDFEETKGNKRPPDTVRWRAPNGDVFWLDQQAAVVMDNAFRSKSLWADKSAVGLGFRAMMTAKNSIVPFRLALSLFHPMHIVGIDIAATMTRQLSGMLAGQVNPVTGIAKILKAGFDPFYANPKVGWKVMRALRGQIPKDQLNAADTEALQHLIDGGLVLDMSAQYRTNARENFRNAMLDAQANFRLRKPGALAWDATRATWHAPWALLSAIQKPIFEDWIPMLKGASYLQDAKMLLDRNPDLIEDRAARQLALRKLAKSAENRYGEMAYNTLFWKRWFKDIAVLNTLSLGWQMGFIREYGGGAMDLGQFARSSDKMQRVKEGLLDRPFFVASYTTLGAAMSGLMTYGFTGKPPTQLLDYIDPQIGGQNPDGTPKRVSTMFYSREFASLYKHMEDQGVVQGLTELAMNKGSGLFGLMHEWYSGVNGFGEEIRDPNSDLFTKTEETLAYTLADMEPISISTLKQQSEQSTGKDKTLAGLGFTPAPKYITETRSEALVSEAYDKYVAPKETPYDRAQYSQDFRKLKKQYVAGDPKYSDTIDSMADKYQLSNADIRRMIRSINQSLSGSVRMFMELPWQEQKTLLDKMPPEERDAYLPHANKEHLRYSYQAPQQ